MTAGKKRKEAVLPQVKRQLRRRKAWKDNMPIHTIANTTVKAAGKPVQNHLLNKKDVLKQPALQIEFSKREQLEQHK